MAQDQRGGMCVFVHVKSVVDSLFQSGLENGVGRREPKVGEVACGKEGRK